MDTRDPNSIILVEKDPNLRQSIALLLQRTGCFVTSTDCVNSAMNIIQDGNFQLLITDIDIPDTRSLLLPRIRGMYPQLSILILTDQASAEIGKVDKLLSAHYLVKPIAPESLLDYVVAIMSNNGKHL